MLALKNVEVIYDDVILVLKGLSLEVPQGKIVALLGPNGAGKSTTIRMLCGILDPSGGSGTVVGYDIARDAERIKERIGYMSQRFGLYEDLSVWENIEFYAGLYSVPRKGRAERIDCGACFRPHPTQCPRRICLHHSVRV